jgi:dihydrofolate reductase
MGIVFFDVSMSLDGFIAGPNDGPGNGLGDGGSVLHEWIWSGKDPTGKKMVYEAMKTLGAVVMGRRTFNIIDGPNGWVAPDGTAFALPVFVPTHEAKDTVTKGKTKFTFVTDGVESAIKEAQKVAGDKNISVMGANTFQQCIKTGLLDEMQIHLVPVLLGGGVRLFDNLGSEHIELKKTSVVESVNVTHLKFRIIKN